MPLNCWREEEGGIFLNSEFDILIIASISPKASVENSSAQWAIFLFITRA